MSLPATIAKSVSELYPLQRNDNARAIVQSVMTGTRDIAGKAVLIRELTADERAALQERMSLLSTNLHHAKTSQISERISRMIMGFGVAQNVGKKDAIAIAAQFAKVLQFLPMWAIERTCIKFESGTVTIDQMEGVNRAYWPSTAQFYPIAEAMCGEFYMEQRNVYAVLHGVVEHKPTPEERERVMAGISELAAHLKRQTEEDDASQRPNRKPWRRPTDEELVASLQRMSEHKRTTLE
jgi:hypothetical protein